MGICWSRRKTFDMEQKSNTELSTLRASRQKYLENIEHDVDSEDTDVEDDAINDADDVDGNCSSSMAELADRRCEKGEGKLDRLDRLGKTKGPWEQERVARKAETIDPRDYDYPFENLVLEGGGNKGIAYSGAIKYLEELGLWKNFKRIAGASAGAMTAALLAVGYNADKIEEFLSEDFADTFLDHKCGYCSLLPNLLLGYGWNPGVEIYDWFGEKLAEQDKNQNPDITFLDVYKQFGKELCVVVTNLNLMCTEYFHPKTTPKVPVRLAVRMSMTIPGLFQSFGLAYHDEWDFYVDGGVLCNYPIHCFDGWWLSMDPEDSFLKRLQPLDNIHRLLDRTERFGTRNKKTIGMLLFADNEGELLRYQVERHIGAPEQDFPDTKLAREKKKKMEKQKKTRNEHRRLVKAANAFLQVLNKHNLDQNPTINRSELSAALEDKEFKVKYRRYLFGDADVDSILQCLDKDKDEEISYDELKQFMEEAGIDVQSRFLGYERQKVNSFKTFLCTLQTAVLTNIKRIHVEDRDVKRTVGINTGHVDTSDFVLDPEDKQFLVKRGRKACEAFLKYYAAAKDLKTREEAQEDRNSQESLATPVDVRPAEDNSTTGDQDKTRAEARVAFSSALLNGSEDRTNDSIELHSATEETPFFKDSKS